MSIKKHMEIDLWYCCTDIYLSKMYEAADKLIGETNLPIRKIRFKADCVKAYVPSIRPPYPLAL